MFKISIFILSILIVSSSIYAQEENPFNLIPNPGFENGLTSWSLFQNPQVWEIDQGNPFIGLQCCKFNPAGIGYYDAEIDAPLVELQPGVEYYYGAHTYDQNTRDTNTSERTIFDIILRDVNSGDYHAILPAEKADGWTQRGIIFTVQEVCTVRPEIHIHGYSTSADAYALVDNILLGILPPISSQESSWGRLKNILNE